MFQCKLSQRREVSCFCLINKNKQNLLGVQQQFSASCSDEVAAWEYEEASPSAYARLADSSCSGRWCDASCRPGDHGASGRTKVCLFF